MSKRYTTNFLEDTNGHTGSVGQVLSSTAAGIDWVTPLSGTVTGTGTADVITKWSNTTGNLVDSIMVEGAAGIGVGGVTITQKFNIGGKLKVTDDIQLAQTNGRIDFDNGAFTGALRFWSTSNSSERMRITSAGNVGIGTTIPDSELDVRSTSSTLPVVLKLGNNINSGDNGIIVSQISSFISNSNTAANELGRIQVNNSASSHDDGNISFWTRDGVSNITAAKQVEISGKGRLDIKNNGTASLPILIFGGDDDTGIFHPSSNNLAFTTFGNERMRINSGGNVSIGNTNNTYKLDVSGTGRFTGPLTIAPTNTSGTQTGLILYDGGGGSSEGLDITFASSADSNTAFIGAASYDQLKFGTASSERMRINSIGNVGIGTTSPDTILDISQALNPTIRLTNTQGSGAPGWDDKFLGGIEFFTEDASGIGAHIGGSIRMFSDVGAGVTPNFNIIFSTSLDNTVESEKMRINKNGNVGIGTEDPSSPLTIKSNSVSSAASAITVMDSTDTNPILQIGEKSTDGARLQMYDAGVQKIALYTDGSDNYINAGNVGIGITGPARKFEVVSSGGIVGVFTSTTGGSYTTYEDSSTTGDNQVRFGAIGDKASIWAGASERISVNTLGAIKFNNYGVGFLQTDASGNITASGSTVLPGGPYLPLIGGTLSGNLTISNTAPSLNFNDSNSTSGHRRYRLIADNDSFQFQKLNDAGSVVNSVPLSFSYTGAATFSDTLAVSGSGDSYFTGNLGIGVTSPDGKLHVSSGVSGASPSGNGDEIVVSNDANAGISILTPNTFIGRLNFGDPEDNDVGKITYDHSIDKLAIFSGAGQAITIDSNQDVGIGVVSPTSKLHIYQSVTDPSLGSPQSFAQHIDSNHSGSAATTGDREQGGLYIDVDSSTTGGDAADEHRVYGIYNRVNHSGDSDMVQGAYNYAEQNTTTGTTTWVRGVEGTAVSDGGASAVMTNIAGVYGATSLQDATPVSNSYGGSFLSNSHSNRTGATINSYGIKSEVQIDSTSAHTNLYAGHFSIDSNDAYTASNAYLLYLKYAGTSLATNTYAIYSDSDVKSYHKGDFGFNVTTPSEKVDVNGGIRLRGALKDINNSAGTSGQVLSSTGAGTDWVTLSDDNDNYYLDGITRSGNILTFSVLGTTNQTYTFGSNAFNSSTIYAEPGIFSGGGTPTLASGVTGAEIRSLIGAGTVTSVAQSHGGNAFSVAGFPITGSGTLAITMAGLSTQYVNGQGNLTTFPSIPSSANNSTITFGAGDGLSGGGTISLNQNFNETVDFAVDLTEFGVGNTLVGTDYLIADNGGTNKRQLVSDIRLSGFLNNSGWTSNTGDITNVTAGVGMTGGGASGSVSLAVGGGDGISVNNSSVYVDSTVVRTTGTQSIGGAKTFSSDITATNFILSSDERLKENIKDLKGSKVEANWKSYNMKDSEGYRTGVIAQELEVNHPEFVETNEEGFKSVKYIDLLVSKIAELEERINQLEK